MSTPSYYLPFKKCCRQVELIMFLIYISTRKNLSRVLMNGRFSLIWEIFSSTINALNIYLYSIKIIILCFATMKPN